MSGPIAGFCQYLFVSGGGREGGRALGHCPILVCVSKEERGFMPSLPPSLSLSLLFLAVSVLSPLALSGGQTTISEGGDDEEE